MTELPGLPPFGSEPAFAADDGAYAALVGRAVTRRRRRLAAGAAATAVAVLFVTVNGPSANPRTGLAPTGDTPSASATPATGPSTSPEPTAGPSGGPGGAPGTGGPEDPRGSGAPRPGGSAEPTPGPGHPPPPEPEPHGDCVDSDGNFVACGGGSPQPGPRPEWTHSSAYVDDRPSEECSQPPVEGWCFRYLGPASATYARDTAFSAELCRLPNGRGAARMDFEKDHELGILLFGPAVGNGSPEYAALSYRTARSSPHSRPIEVGRCLRWTVTWNGVDDEGLVVRPGRYELRVLTLGSTPREPLPGEANQETKSSYAVSIEDFAIR